jgi:hypothetical protein
MSGTSITSPGSKKSAVSTQTAYDSAKAVTQKAIKAQQDAAKLATLKKTNDALKATLKNDQASVTTNNQNINYVQAMYVKGKWGPDAIQNNTIAWLTGTTGAHTPGSSITLSDKTKLDTFVSTWTSVVSSTSTAVDKLKTTISKNQNQIDLFSKTPGGSTTSTTTKKTNNNTQTAVPKPPPEWPDSSYQWNLPPHTWSLPKDPSEVNPGFVNKQEGSLHATRRGRIWYYNGYVGKNSQAQYDYNNTGTFSAAAGASKTPPPGTVNKYGFQFIWNPETFSQNTAVNMAVTPSYTDPTVTLTGFAAANSQMTFTIRLDRTNDFASIKAENLSTTLSTTQQTPADIQLAAANAALYAAGKVSQQDISKTQSVTAGVVEAHGLANYYKVGQPIKGGESSANNINQKIVDLLNYGTESDLEYLYKTINGDGWTGIGGRDTSNIGYLMPALIRLDLGNQKFVGVVSSVSVNHLAFTRNMIPIRSDVNITVDLRANIQPTTNVNPGKK